MAPPRRSTVQQDSSDDDDDLDDEETYEPINKNAPPIKYNNLAEEITAAIRQAEASAAKATSLALAASMKPAFSFNPSLPPPLPPGPDGQPYNEQCARCHSLHIQNTKLGVNMQNFRAMYTNLHRDYMQLYTSHNELAEQNTSLMKANALLEEQAKYMKKVTEKEDLVLQALRSFRRQRKLIRKEKGRRDRASQVQKVLASFAEHALPDDIKIRQVDFTVEYKKDNGESVFDIYTLREGKRTKIKNDRERARILGLKEPAPPQLRPPAALKKLAPPTRKDGMDGLAGLQQSMPGQPMGLQLLQAAYVDDQRLRSQAAAQQQQRMAAGAYSFQQGYAMPTYPGYTQAYAAQGHMQQYGQTYDILPPLPGMPQAQPQAGAQNTLLQMQQLQNMQNSMWGQPAAPNPGSTS